MRTTQITLMRITFTRFFPRSKRTTSRANELVQQVARLYEVIRASTADHERSAAIGELVRCLHRQWPLVAVQHVLDDQRITNIQPALWRVLSDVECKAEASGARELLQRSSLSLHDVLAFRHGGDYEPLIARELRCLFEAAPHLQGKSFRCTFIGSGPVPLSAILIHKHTTATVQCIDIDPVATELAASLLGRLGLSHAVVARCSLTCDATILQCIENTEVVFVASLVQDKAQILRQLKAGTIVAVRSADGLYSILYEPIDRSEVTSMGFTELVRNRSQQDTINSTFYYMKN